MKKGLYIVATPIGNLGDISSRAIETLKQADVIACEDTRISKKLLSLLGVGLNKEFITLHDHNEEVHAEELIKKIQEEDKSVALISDAGSPLISDPGYKLIRRCRQEDIYITVLPGCCALICALQLAGLPTNKFMFCGFIPNKDKGRAEAFEEIKSLKATTVFYETANRILKTLDVVQKVFGDREIAIAREISKIYEECLNGSAAELIAHFEDHTPKGEMVLMISPAQEEEKTDINLEEELRRRLQTKSVKTAVKELSEETGISKKEIYQIALRIKDEE